MALSNPTMATATSVQSSTGGITSLASGSITPTAGCLLFVCGGVDQDAAGTETVTIGTTLANVGTWTVFQQPLPVPANGTTGFFAYARVTGSPGTGTVTANFTLQTDAAVLMPGWVTGHNTTTPIAQSIVSGGGTGSTATATLGSTPATSNMVLGVVVRQTGTNAAATMTPGAGFTEAAQQYIWNPGYGFGIEGEVQYQNGASPPTSVTATALGTINGWEVIAVEIAQAGTSSPVGRLYSFPKTITRAATR